jgi:hypothetical protein
MVEAGWRRLNGIPARRRIDVDPVGGQVYEHGIAPPPPAPTTWFSWYQYYAASPSGRHENLDAIGLDEWGLASTRAILSVDPPATFVSAG